MFFRSFLLLNLFFCRTPLVQKTREDRPRVAMAGTLPPLFEITADDHGGYGAVAVYTLLALTIVIVSTRLSTRWFIGRVVHPDDILLGISLVSRRCAGRGYIIF